MCMRETHKALTLSRKEHTNCLFGTKWSALNVHTSNIIETGWVVVMYLGTHTYTTAEAATTTKKKGSHRLEREQGSKYLRRFEGRKGKGELCTL